MRCAVIKAPGGIEALLHRYKEGREEKNRQGYSFKLFTCSHSDVELEPLTDEEYDEIKRLGGVTSDWFQFAYQIAYNLPQKFFKTYFAVYPDADIRGALLVLDADPFEEEHSLRMFRPRRVNGQPFLPLLLLRHCPLNTAGITRDAWQQCVRIAKERLPTSTGTPLELTPDQQAVLAKIVEEANTSWAVSVRKNLAQSEAATARCRAGDDPLCNRGEEAPNPNAWEYRPSTVGPHDGTR